MYHRLDSEGLHGLAQAVGGRPLLVVRLHVVVVVEVVMVPNSIAAPDPPSAAAPHSGVEARRPRNQPIEGRKIAHCCPAHGAHDCFVQVEHVVRI